MNRQNRTLSNALLTLGGACIISLLPTAEAHAQMPALSFIGYSTAWEYTQDSYVIGWEFTTNAPITVSALGWYNDTGQPNPAYHSGLTSDHPVGIYDIAANAFVAQTDVLATDPLTGVFSYHNLAGVVNLPGGKQYAIVGVSFSDPYISFAPSIANFVTVPEVTYIGGAIDYSGGATSLHAPVQYYPGGSYWPATNFMSTPQVSSGVPEPGQDALIVGFITSAAMLLRRRRS